MLNSLKGDPDAPLAAHVRSGPDPHAISLAPKAAEPGGQVIQVDASKGDRSRRMLFR
jgi:hypothetical protein